MKTKTAHTPGPWRIRGTNYGYTTCYVLGPPHKDGGDYAPICVADTEANARLIAAAPELLAALEECEKDLIRSSNDAYDAEADSLAKRFMRTAKAARAAIAKAKGEA